MEVLKALRLPMPDDVLEQFVHDHGIRDEFQCQYGELDLHSIRWRIEPITAERLLSASIYPPFAKWVETVANRTRVVPAQGWTGVLLPPGAARHWQQKRTWIRPPVFLSGVVLRRDISLHLVEGHTRLGALRGLVESGMIAPTTLHEVWLGERC
jgi:hypothetical protein